jgi:hypothetical protein
MGCGRAIKAPGRDGRCDGHAAVKTDVDGARLERAQARNRAGPQELAAAAAAGRDTACICRRRPWCQPARSQSSSLRSKLAVLLLVCLIPAVLAINVALLWCSWTRVPLLL